MSSVEQKKIGRRMSKKQARRHSKVVKAARYSLPIMIVGILAAYAITATPLTVDESFLDQFAKLDVKSNDLRLEQPQFLGEDKEGVAFEVSAGAAVQNPLAPKFVRLENPEALKALGTIDQALVTAKTGLYSMDAKKIDLNTQVEFKQGIGADEFILNMDAAEVFLDNREVHSNVAVYGENDNGSLQADGMTAYQDEGRTVFHNAKMIINPKRDEDGKKKPNTSDDKDKGEQPET